MAVPREAFVPPTYHNLAFADISIPLAHDQVMLSPKLEGRILQTVQIQRTDTVLEIGTGSGYLTALLAQLAKQVNTVDLFEDFIQETAQKLNRFQIENVLLSQGDAIEGWHTQKHYDVIILTGSLPVLTADFQSQLTLGGRLFAIVGEAPIMQAQLITRTQEKEWLVEDIFETVIPPLIGASPQYALSL